MLARVHTLQRAIRLQRRLPRSLRRPGPALRATAVGISLWFAALFGALGLGGAGSTTVSTAFVGAALAGAASATLVGLGRIQHGLWCLAAMLATGQLAAVSMPF